MIGGICKLPAGHSGPHDPRPPVEGNAKDLDALAQRIRNARVSKSYISWDNLNDGLKNEYRNAAQAVLNFLAEQTEEDEKPAQMGEDELAQLLYMARTRYYCGERVIPTWSSLTESEQGTYLAQARAVIEAGQAPKPQGFTIRNAKHEVVVDSTLTSVRPDFIPEYAWVGRNSDGLRFFAREEHAKSWLQISQRSGAKLYKIRIDWAVHYELMLVPGSE